MELGEILQYAGEHGPYLVIIALVLRSSAKKDAMIENLTRQALEMAHQTRNAAAAASAAVRIVTDNLEGR
jgi:hypothetical protein